MFHWFDMEKSELSDLKSRREDIAVLMQVESPPAVFDH